MIRAAGVLAASTLWSSLNAASRRLGQRTRLGSRVISVGNIQGGGAGKTPLVAWIARQAAQRGVSACVLCRGYLGEWEHSPGGGVIEPRTATRCDPKLAGDEAALLHEVAPDAWIGVGKDRAKQFERVLSLAGRVDLVILDDGFQNRRIKKDLEIVALTSSRPWERVFRDFKSELKRAHLLVWTKGDRAPISKGAAWARCPMLRARLRVKKPPSLSPESPVVLVTGVGDAKSVRHSVEEAGVKIEAHWQYPDHYPYEVVEIQGRIQEARAQGWQIALTGKDWVKWKEAGVSSRDLIVLEPEIEMSEPDRMIWDKIVWSC